MQVYLEEILDLLNPTGQNLQIREHPDTHETYVQDLVTVPVKGIEQAMTLINAGLDSRAIASQVIIYYIRFGYIVVANESKFKQKSFYHYVPLEFGVLVLYFCPIKS